MSYLLKGYAWIIDKEKGNVKYVYVYKIIGNDEALVLVGNLKNLNPHHSIETKDWDRFDDDPTNEQLEQHCHRCFNKLLPINPNTGHEDDAWLEKVPVADLKTTTDVMNYINTLCA